MILNNRIDTRIAAIAAALERRRMEQEAPVDALSQCLYKLEQELSGLDKLGKAALLAELNRSDPLEGTMPLNLTMPDLERMIVEAAR